MRVAIVTGSGGPGSGRAEALKFAREGFRVVVSDVDEPGSRETVHLIHAAGGTAGFCKANCGVETEVQELIRFAECEFGGLDVLVNNASAPYRPGSPLEFWTETVSVDVLGTMWATRAAIDAFRRHGRGGAVVNVGSTSAAVHKDSRGPAYDAAKAAVMRFSTSLGWLAAERIRVNCVVPDWIATPEVKSYWDALKPDERVPPAIPNVLTTLNEVADAVFRVATDESIAGRALIWWSGRQPFWLPYSGKADESI